MNEDEVVDKAENIVVDIFEKKVVSKVANKVVEIMV